jgi:glutamate carboxypeptidase
MMRRRLTFALLFVTLAGTALAQTPYAVRAQAREQKQPLLDTLRDLVAIESGSGDIDGIRRIGALVADRLRRSAARCRWCRPPRTCRGSRPRPMLVGDTIVARFRGRGTKRILLLAHMDTVYQHGMLAQQPFRVDGDRAYGLGIGDDKHGVALILHTLTALKALNFDRYGLVTVLISPDEEIGSVAERDLIASLGAEHDLVLSCEGSPLDESVRLATVGRAARRAHVKGPRVARRRRARAGAQRRLRAGAPAAADARPVEPVQRREDELDGGERRQRAQRHSRRRPRHRRHARRRCQGLRRRRGRDSRADQEPLIPDTTVDVTFERLYPPLPFREQSLKAAQHAQKLYAEAGGTLKVATVSTGGGTDASFAALRTAAPVIEGLGLRSFGAHSNNAEYIHISSIEPRLYLLTRMVMDAADGAVPGMR